MVDLSVLGGMVGAEAIAESLMGEGTISVL